MRSNASVWSRRILDASVAMEDTCGEHSYCIPCAYGAPAKSDTVHAEVPIDPVLSFFLLFYEYLKVGGQLQYDRVQDKDKNSP